MATVSERQDSKNGQPKTAPYSEAHRILADLLVKDLRISQNDTLSIAVAKTLARKALKGSIRAAKEISDRVEGRPRQRHELCRVDGEPVEVKAKLDGPGLVKALREIYGLADPDEQPPAESGERRTDFLTLA